MSNFNKYKGFTRSQHKSLTSYDRYLESLENEDTMSQYVVDNEGGLHDMSGNLETKMASINKSKDYWENKLSKDPKNSIANKFYNKFEHLCQQVEIFLEGNETVAHI